MLVKNAELELPLAISLIWPDQCKVASAAPVYIYTLRERGGVCVLEMMH